MAPVQPSITWLKNWDDASKTKILKLRELRLRSELPIKPKVSEFRSIDGADEISSDFQGIKGGGAALLYEKIVATNSDKVMWIVDESKMVDKLGRFPLPVEVIPYGSQKIFERFEKKGLNPAFRKDDKGGLLLTDSDNYIIDLHLGQIDNPHELAEYLIHQVGVVEHGLFLDMVDTVIVGRQNGPEVLEAK